ncbi:MAG: hypothetical protein V2I43_19890 [Parvularcula sp.]|jgi:hypothetical protein|nr:hypothetical protein [Parvularcula sp.]
MSNHHHRRLEDADRDHLFPEFRREEDAAATEEAPALPQRPQREPAILSVMRRLADLLGEEARLIREGNFEAFAELQREKGVLIRQAERLERNPSALEAVEALDPAALKEMLEGFNETVGRNMRAIGAVKDAIIQVRSRAIRRLEEEKGDGVYSKDGERKSLHRLSLNETKVKL